MTLEELNDIFQQSQNLEDLYDKQSKAYQAQVALNKLERKKIDNALPQALREAVHLDDKTKNRYVYLAELYTQDMKANILKDQFELSTQYPEVTPDEWNDFLSDRIVNTYVQKHKRTLLKAAAEFNLALPGAKNKRDSLQVIKNIEDKEQGEMNKNICILRIPDIYNDDEE